MKCPIRRRDSKFDYEIPNPRGLTRTKAPQGSGSQPARTPEIITHMPGDRTASEFEITSSCSIKVELFTFLCFLNNFFRIGISAYSKAELTFCASLAPKFSRSFGFLCAFGRLSVVWRTSLKRLPLLNVFRQANRFNRLAWIARNVQFEKRDCNGPKL